MHSPRPARVGRGRSPRPSWRGDLRPFLAPAVVQASAMDCGPAALSALLAGHGVAASPDRLREMCRTDVDGTSIDALAVAARRHGLDCSQVVVPVEHLTHSDRLPALAVTRRADGLTHVVVVWRRHRRWFQVMDPAVGRRLMRHRRLLELLHVHEQAVPVATYARIASTGSFRSGLLARIRALGIADAEALVARAAGDGAATARLDAAVRGAARGRCHGRSATRAVLAALADPAAIDDTAWYARPGRPGSATVTLRGAVLLQPRPAPTGRPALTPPTAPTPSAATGTSRRTGPGRNRAPVAGSVGAVLPAGDGRIVRRLAVGAALAGVGATAEVALLGTALDRGGQVAPLLAVAIFGALLAGIELSTARAALLVGRRLDLGVRRWLAQQLHRIPDRYLRTRAASDLAERAHSVHLLRRIPAAGAAGLGAAARLVATTVGLCVLAPGHSPLVVALALVLVACTGATLPARREIELHRQETAGALAQLELDVLLSTRHGPPADTADALAGEHGRRLAAWRRATRVAARGRAATVGLQAGVAAAGTVAVAGAALAGLDGAGTELLFLVWLAGMATAVEELTAALVRWPEDRAVAGRLGDLLAATRAGPEPDLPSTHPARAPGPGTDPTVTTRPREGSVATAATEATGAGGPDTGPVATPSVDVTGTGGPSTGVDLRTTSAPGSGTAVELRGVTVAVAGRTVLDHVDLKVPPGQHVALVGRSGAGKSSILEVVLGLQAPVEGDVRLDGRPPAGGGGHRSTVAWVGAETRLWDRSIEANVAGPDRDAALDACGLVDLAARLDGDNVGDDGARLSLDERQRLRLARALAQPGVHLAVVDEALRHATPAARRALLSRARRSWAAATVLCATHDIDLAATFDRVVVVEGGTIVEDGRPDELLRRPGSRLAALHRADRDVRQRLGALHGSSPAPHDGPAALHGGPAPSSALEPGTSGNPTGGDRHPGRARTVAVTGGPTPNVPATDEPNPTVAANDEPPGRAHRPARRRPLVARAALAAAVHGARHLTMGLAWVLVAGPILADGRGGATSEWALALAATAALTAAAAWIEVDLGASVAARWRSRMLAHALAAGGNGVGAEGPARTLGRVFELERATRGVTEGNLALASAAVEVAVAVALLLSTSAGPGRVAALVVGAGTLSTAGLARRHRHQLRLATDHRLASTGRLSERLAGHRTELLQGGPVAGSPDPDDRYAAIVAAADGTALALQVGVARAVGVLGLLVLAQAGATAEVATTGPVLGGLLLATAGLRQAGSALLAANVSRTGIDQVRALLATSGAGGSAPGDERGAACARPVRVGPSEDDHVVLAPLAFNLLAARRWPPVDVDLAEARSACEDLGLGPVVARMPGGLDQVVGATGWRLSDGERALVAVARASLSGRPVELGRGALDALDPLTAQRTLDALAARAERDPTTPGGPVAGSPP